VLSFLEPKDLLQAAQTCRYWRILAEDNLLWREKCKEEGIDEPLHIKRRKVIKPGFIHSPWKSAYIRQHRIDTNWRRGELKSPKVLKGHDDHVITCLQFCGNRIVSGSDDNTLKVWSAVTGKVSLLLSTLHFLYMSLQGSKRENMGSFLTTAYFDNKYQSF